MKRKRGTIQDTIDRAVADGRLSPWHDVWVNQAGYMDSEAMLYLVTCIGNRIPCAPDGSYVLLSLLVDACPSHKNDAVKAMCDKYNILLFIIMIAGGLTPKANMADVEYIKSTKNRYNAELTKVRATKYAEMRQQLTDENGVV